MSLVHSLSVAIVMFSANALLSPSSYAASAQQEVRAAYTAWDKAFEKADAKAIASFYADDAIFLPTSHEVIRGRAGVEKFFSVLFGMGVTGHKLDLIDARAEGKLLYGTAKWSANGKDASGKDQPWGGLATHIFERQRGGLKIKLHTFN